MMRTAITTTNDANENMSVTKMVLRGKYLDAKSAFEARDLRGLAYQRKGPLVSDPHSPTKIFSE
jgi:hypothetical protein